MINFKNNIKLFSRFQLNITKSLVNPKFFNFSTDSPKEDPVQTKIQPKIIQKIRKMDIKKHSIKVEKKPIEEVKQNEVVETPKIKEEKTTNVKANKQKEKIKKLENRADKVHSSVEPYFLNKAKQEDLDFKSFSIAKLMEYNSSETRKKIKHIETTLMLNKDLVNSMSKTEIKSKLNSSKEEIIRELPKNLYRMTSEEMSQHTPLVQQAMGLHNASIGEMRKARILEIRRRFGKHERDTAAPAITASVLCENVIHLLNHIKLHKNDMSAFIKLKTYLTKRRKYLRYLKHKDFQGYAFIVKYYGIRDIQDANAKSFKRMLRI